MSASNTHKHAPPCPPQTPTNTHPQKKPIFNQVFTLFIVLKFCRAYLLEKHKNTRISQFTKPTTSTNNLNSNSNTLNFNMDTLFREFSELMDDANDKMPEGTYLALYNKLKELKDKVSESPGYDNGDTADVDGGGVPDRIVRAVQREGARAAAFISHLRQAKEVSDAKIKELEEAAQRSRQVSDAKIKELEEAALRSRPRCRCGSTDHLKTNFLGCRLNKRVLAGVLGTATRDRALDETAALANPPTEV